MSNLVIKTPAAKQDLRSIADYIAADNVDAALRFLDTAEHAFSSLADMPKMGEAMDFTNIPGCRHWVMPEPFSNYVIFYIPLETGGIKLIRVLHGARNIDDIFDY